jgi:hypothetical protein
MDYIAVPVNDRIEFRPKDPSHHPTPIPTAIVSMSVDACPMRLCIKMEFGNITSICKHMKTFGGLQSGKPLVGSVTCNHDKGSSDIEVTLLVASSCPAGKRGCISLENGERKKCAYLIGILQPMPTVRLHYSIVCNHPKVRKGNPRCSENVQSLPSM